jgi:hypothetical protein
LRNHDYVAIEIRWVAVVNAIADLILTTDELAAIKSEGGTTPALASGLARVVGGDSCSTARNGVGRHSCVN